MILLAAVTLLTLSATTHAFAKASAAGNPLIGVWNITHRPVDAAGKPCPFLPESIKFLDGQTLMMSNIPNMQLPYKTDLTADERQALEKRSEWFKGKKLLLVKPNPRMDWRTTPMVYTYTVSKDDMTLTVQGWETATFKRGK
jgi:hypothetical protein